MSDDGGMTSRGQGEGRRKAASNGRGKPTATTSEAPRWHSATRVQSEYKGRDRCLVPMTLFSLPTGAASSQGGKGTGESDRSRGNDGAAALLDSECML